MSGVDRQPPAPDGVADGDPDRDTTAHDDVARSRLTLRDLWDDATAAVAARGARSALTALGTLLGVAALVATLGLGTTAASQIVERFDELAATSVQLEAPDRTVGRQQARVSLPDDSVARVTRLRGVTAAATLTEVALDDPDVRRDVEDARPRLLRVQAVDGDLLGAFGATLSHGVALDGAHQQRGDRVALLGARAAEDLEVTGTRSGPTVVLDGQAFTVIGIIDSTQRAPALLSSVVVPQSTAVDRLGLDGVQRLQVDTALGAASQVAEQAQLAIDPAGGLDVEVTAPATFGGTRRVVRDDLDSLLLALGGLALLVGGIGIANTVLVSVIERRGEIGLRRSLGAARRHVVAQFLLEAGLLGGLGGLVGTSVGLAIVVGGALANGWTPVLEPWLVPTALVVGAVVGLLAGIWPSLRAAKIDPIDALRG